MKKIFTLGVSLLFAILSFAQSQRVVLFEEFTGENCPPCYSQNPYVDALVDEAPNEVILIHYLAPIPTAGILSNQVSSVVNSRMSYYGVNSTPWGQQDGAMWDSSLLASYGNGPITWCANLNTGAVNPSYLDAEYNVPSPFSISITDILTTSTDSFYATVTITGSEAYTSNGALKLQVAMVEDLNFSYSPGNNSETSWTNAVRGMYPTPIGTTLPATWTSGQVQTYNVKGKIPAFVRDKSKLRFVAFAQDASKHIQQAGISDYFKFNVDISTTGVQGNFDNCNSSQYTPVLNLSNVGTQAITSCYISEYLDNTFLDSVQWTGNLDIASQTNYQFAPLSVTSGVHKLTFKITRANNSLDPNPGNDSASITLDIPVAETDVPFTEGFENGNPITAGWSVESPDHDSTWRVVAHGNGSAHSFMEDYYDDLYNDFVGPIDNFYAPPLNLTYAAHATVVFSFANQWVDFGGGSYGWDSLSVDVSTDCGSTWTEVYATNVATAPAQSVNSAVAFVPTISQWKTDSADISSVANHDEVLVRFRPQSFDGNNLYLDNINIYKYDSVPYTPSGITSLTNVQSVSVYPNPANTQVNVSVQLANNNPVSYQITDVTGNIVSTNAAEFRNAGQNNFTVNTSGFADGVYFVTVIAGAEKVSKLVVITH